MGAIMQLKKEWKVTLLWFCGNLALLQPTAPSADFCDSHRKLNTALHRRSTRGWSKYMTFTHCLIDNWHHERTFTWYTFFWSLDIDILALYETEGRGSNYYDSPRLSADGILLSLWSPCEQQMPYRALQSWNLPYTAHIPA